MRSAGQITELMSEAAVQILFNNLMHVHQCTQRNVQNTQKRQPTFKSHGEIVDVFN